MVGKWFEPKSIGNAVFKLDLSERPESIKKLLSISSIALKILESEIPFFLRFRIRLTLFSLKFFLSFIRNTFQTIHMFM